MGKMPNDEIDEVKQISIVILETSKYTLKKKFFSSVKLNPMKPL